VPEAPVASAERVIVMSTRPELTCCVKTAATPPDRKNSPSCTVRTRRTAGSKVTVTVIVDSRDTFEIDTGMVYGPPPICIGVDGGGALTTA
jgi:hypothetical protein